MINYSMKPTKTLIPYERNPRNNDSAVDAVAESIKEFGIIDRWEKFTGGKAEEIDGN